MDTATDVGSLGMVYAVQRKWKEALPLLKQVRREALPRPSARLLSTVCIGSPAPTRHAPPPHGLLLHSRDQAHGVLVSCLEPQAPNLLAISRFYSETSERVRAMPS